MEDHWWWDKRNYSNERTPLCGGRRRNSNNKKEERVEGVAIKKGKVLRRKETKKGFSGNGRNSDIKKRERYFERKKDNSKSSNCESFFGI